MAGETGSDRTAVQFIEIDADYAGQRIDNYLFRELKGVPKSRVYRILRRGEVRLNGKRVKPDRKLSAGDTLRIPPVRMGDEKSASRPGHAMIDKVLKSIIYEDNLIFILNKPAGIAVHGGSGISAGIIETLRQLKPEERGLELVHRLDRDTSGCLMVSRRRSALRKLQAALREKTAQNQESEGMHKFYTVIVSGKWPRRKTLVDLPLTKNMLASGERVSRVAADGRPSVTRFRLLATAGELSLLEAEAVTGRTHQIRVHCAASGYPVLGDEKYGGLAAARMMLHASRLVIPNWGEEGQTLELEAPEDAAFVSQKDIFNQ
jgi:23S rRNA pseudouridine955/2504/2580 synthase